MEFAALQLWQRTALRPSDANGPSRPARLRPEGRADFRDQEARRAREARRRLRETVARGLFLSMLLGGPVGWSFVHSTLLHQDPTAQEACPAVASLLRPALERDVRELSAHGALSKDQRRMLGMQVCDPGVRLVLGPILRGVSDLGELRDLAKSGAAGGALAAPPLSAAIGW